jgi:hypothetical protein
MLLLIEFYSKYGGRSINNGKNENDAFKCENEFKLK